MNFVEPTATKPCLLVQDKLRQLFHELGHAMHNLLSKTKYARFHGTGVNTDFVEVPSVLFEHILWTPSLLEDLSHHYSHLSPKYMEAWKEEKSNTPNKISTLPLKISRETVDKLLSAKELNRSVGIMGTVFLSTVDLTVHGESTHDMDIEELASLYNKIRGDVTGLDMEESPSYGFSTFRGIMGNYDAGYYTYAL
jgi:metallopeptidase MepB